MAVKGEEGCSIVKDERLKEKLRDFRIDLLKRHSSEQAGLDYVAPGQPFFLRLMKDPLAYGGDADREFLLQGEAGFPVGVLSPFATESTHVRRADKLEVGGRSTHAGRNLEVQLPVGWTTCSVC